MAVRHLTAECGCPPGRQSYSGSQACSIVRLESITQCFLLHFPDDNLKRAVIEEFFWVSMSVARGERSIGEQQETTRVVSACSFHQCFIQVECAAIVIDAAVDGKGGKRLERTFCASLFYFAAVRNFKVSKKVEMNATIKCKQWNSIGRSVATNLTVFFFGRQMQEREQQP